MLWTVMEAAAAVLAIRKRWRLVCYLLASTAGAPVLDPVLKSLAGRRRVHLGDHRGRGELVVKYGNGNVLGDETILRWLATHRTAGLTRWSAIVGTLGATRAILIVSVATCAVFLALTRRFLVPAIAMPVLVAVSRMYRGEHHPADVLGSILFSAFWITTLFLLVRPNQQDGDRAPAAHSAPLSSPAARTAAGTGRTR